MLKTGFVVVFYRDEINEVPISADKVPINADKIIMYLEKNGKITNRQARELLRLNSTRVKVIFKELCDSNIIVPYGDNRGRYYTLK